MIDFSEISPKNPAKSAVFYWLFLGEVSPRNFPWHRPIFLTICPWKSFETWLFSAKIARNRPIFLRILTFLPRKSRKIGRFLREFWLFFPRKSREISRFFREFPLDNPAKFCFFFREISEALHTVCDIIMICSTVSSVPLYNIMFRIYCITTTEVTELLIACV